MAWCIRGSFTPTAGHAWASAITDPLYTLTTTAPLTPNYGNLPARNGSIARSGRPVSVSCSVIHDAHSGQGIMATLTDDGGNTSRVYLTLGASVVATPSAGSTHTISLCYEDGMLTLFFDDVKIDYQTDRLGLVTVGATPTITGGTVNTGFTATSLAVTEYAYPNGATKTRYNILWLGDSVALNPNELQDFSGRLAGSGYQATWSLAAYGSNTMGNGFLELSDSIYAYESSAWQPRARWKPLSSYDMVAFDYLDNEVESIPAATNGKMLTAEYRRGYDKIVHQATKNIPRTIMASSPPECAGDFSAWGPNAATTAAQAVLAAISAKWNVPLCDYWHVFQDDVTAGNHTIANLMRDTLHPTQTAGAAGITLMADTMWPYLLAVAAPIAATPEISGSVVSYLWGQPTAGTWTITSLEQITNTYPGESANYRVARYPDQANVASASGAKLLFPPASFQMLYVHTIGTGANGTFDVVIDRGLGTEVRKSFQEQAGGNYPRSFFVKDWGSAATRTVEVETTSSAEVHIVGVSYIGVP